VRVHVATRQTYTPHAWLVFLFEAATVPKTTVTSQSTCSLTLAVVYRCAHRSSLRDSTLRSVRMPLGKTFSNFRFRGVNRTWRWGGSKSANDPGCVKTPQTEKRLEWFFSDRAKSNTVKISHAPKCGSEEDLFCCLRASLRFYSQDPKQSLSQTLKDQSGGAIIASLCRCRLSDCPRSG
jgi:hypothetical protein